MPQGEFLEPGQSLRDLKTLEVLEESPSISQRELSKRLGIALGLTNACLTRMAKKGLIKVSRLNSRGLTYHLTPEGFAAKARLSLEYARTTVGIYRTGREAVGRTIMMLADRGVSRIGVFGANEIGEILSVVCAHEGISIAHVADGDAEAAGRWFMGRPIGTIHGFETSGCQAVVVARFEDAEHWALTLQNCLPSHIMVVTAL